MLMLIYKWLKKQRNLENQNKKSSDFSLLHYLLYPIFMVSTVFVVVTAGFDSNLLGFFLPLIYLCVFSVLIMFQLRREESFFGITIFSVFGFIYFMLALASNWVVLLLGIFAVTELIYWFLDDKVPEKTHNKMWFTVTRKLEAFIQAIILIFTGIWFAVIAKYIKVFELPFATIGFYLLMIFGVVGFAYGFVWLNSLKYKNKKVVK